MGEVAGTCGSAWPAIAAGLWIVHLILEYWLGRTDKVKAGSLVELVITAGVALALLFLRRENDDGSKGNPEH